MTLKVQANALKEFVKNVFIKVDVPIKDSEIISKCLIEANLRGIDSHGVMRLFIYVPRFKTRATNPTPKIKVKQTTPFATIIDGDNGLGHLIGTKSMETAITMSKKEGIGIVSAINSNHFGAAGYFSTMAAENKLIGIAISNTCPAMPAIGGKTPVVGNGPFSISLPVSSGFPVCLDFSTSAGAYGKVLLAAKSGEKIPQGWAVDKLGLATEDPNKAIESQLLLPFAGHKGFGIAFMIDVLCSALGDTYFGTEVYNIYESGFEEMPGRVSHLFAAISPGIMGNGEHIFKHVEQAIKFVHSSKLSEGCENVFYPGEKEWITKIEREVKGIPISDSVAKELEKIGNQNMIQVPWK